jgi:hypothetical protein
VPVKIGAAVCSIVLCLACQKLEPAPTTTKGQGLLQFDAVGSLDAIPLDYGTLVGVAQASPGWVSLWFQRPDHTIVVSFVNIDQGRVYEKSLTIPRASAGDRHGS